MNNTFTKELASWIAGLIDSAKNDEHFDVAWFKRTEESTVSIIGGWLGGNYVGVNDDLFCTSKSNPDQIMCVKIIINRGPYAYADFETLNMPIDPKGEVEDICIMLEWNDDPEALANFFANEWASITEAYELGVYY